jgi:hypothetical protein
MEGDSQARDRSGVAEGGSTQGSQQRVQEAHAASILAGQYGGISLPTQYSLHSSHGMLPGMLAGGPTFAGAWTWLNA